MGDVVVVSDRGEDIYTHGDFEEKGVYFSRGLFHPMYLRIPLFMPWGLVLEGLPYEYVDHPDIIDALKQEGKKRSHSIFVSHSEGETELLTSTLNQVASPPIRVESFLKVLPRDDPSERLFGSDDFLVFHDWRSTLDGESRSIENLKLLPSGIRGER